ncbi:MAG: Crp/Fnr family transcriptional regulator [Rhodobacteraceae bacterium]|nr:Crp/Fnr family transcriptional regulator [Paracoccaceae bacterium]
MKLSNTMRLGYDFDHMHFDPFSYLPPDASHAIDTQQGDVLFRQDQPTSGLYRVLAGCVTLRRTSLGGEPLTLHRAVSGGYFAEASLFSDTYHCEAICTQAGSVLKIAKNAISATMLSNPEFSAGLTRLLAIQVQQYRAHIELLAIRSAIERVFAAYKAGYLATTIPEFASRINLTQEAFYRALRALCDDGRMRRIGRGRYALL